MLFAVVLVCLLSLASGYGGLPPKKNPPPRNPPRIPAKKDCIVRWDDWSDCSKSCGDGKQSRVATIIQQPSYGGQPCPSTTDYRHCNTFDCPTVYVVTTTAAADVPITTTKQRYPTTTIVRDAATLPSGNAIMCSMLPDGNYESGKCQRIYFTCTGQALKTQSCPHGQIFDPAYDRCDVPSNTQTCTGTPATPRHDVVTVTHGTPAVDIHFNCHGKDNADYPDAELPCSNIYYSCNSGLTSRRKCPHNLWFDPELLICDSFNRVPICSGHARPTEILTTLSTHSTVPPPFDCSNQKLGNYPDPTHSCSHVYYACHSGITETFLCPEDLYYDASRDSCHRKDHIVACGGQLYEHSTTQRAETLPAVHYDCWGKPDGFYSDPDNKCSEKYFACSGNVAKEFHCQSGLIYSASLLACAHPDETFECTGTSPVPTTTAVFVPSTTQAVPFDCTPFGDGFYNDPAKQCSSIYYSCSAGVALQLSCPSATFFDIESGLCDFYQNVYACSNERRTSVVTEATTEELTTVPEYDCTRQIDGLYPIPFVNCSHEFYSCSNGYTHKERCPGRLYFDPQSSICDSYGNIFACTGHSKRTTTPRTTTVRDELTTEKLPINCVNQPDGEYADPEAKCSAVFYMCSYGVAHRLFCPAQLYFDATLNVCAQWLDVFDCAGKTRPPTTERTTTPPQDVKELPIDCTNKPNGEYADPKNSCSQTFYTCSNYHGFERACPFDLVFDITTGVCEVSVNVPACGGHARTTAESTSTQLYLTTPSPYDCSTKKSGNYPAGDCEDYFWVCVGGQTSRQNCPRGLRFDAEFNLCNFGEFMPTCGGTRETTAIDTSTVTPIPPVLPVDCSQLDDGNVVDPNQKCSELFYMCANGVTFEQKCPSGLRYHQEKDECDNLSEIPACAGVIPNPISP